MAKLKTFTAKMQRHGQQPRYVPECTVYHGYLVQVSKRGVGKSWEEGGIGPSGDGDTWTVWERYEEYLKPYFNGANMPDDVKSILRELETVQDVIAAGYEKYLLKFGEQDGYTITNYEDEKAEKQREHTARAEREVAGKSIPIPVSFGYFGLQIGERLPPETWAKIKHTATYHKGDEDDLEWLDDMGHIGVNGYEVRGWYYETGVVEILTSEGYTIQYHGETVTDTASLKNASEKRAKAESAHYDRVKQVKQEAGAWKRLILDKAYESGPCTKEEAEKASYLPRITLLDMQGPDIYGGGSWLHRDGTDLYYVDNNGMDGDNWSHNNYPTGGAGAICYHIPGAAHIIEKIENWIKSISYYAVYTEGR